MADILEQPAQKEEPAPVPIPKEPEIKPATSSLQDLYIMKGRSPSLTIPNSTFSDSKSNPWRRRTADLRLKKQESSKKTEPESKKESSPAREPEPKMAIDMEKIIDNVRELIHNYRDKHLFIFAEKHAQFFNKPKPTKVDLTAMK